MEFLDHDTFVAKAAEWAGTLGLQTMDPVRLESPALLVIDMQKDFLLPDGLLKVWGGPAIIDNVGRLVRAFRSSGRPVFFTRHIYEEPERDGGATARWWKVDSNSMLLREGTWHAELHEALTLSGKDKVISKRRYSAFFGSDLEILLRTSQIKDVIISGVCTNICCEATAHDAFFRDFNVWFLIDGTGATDEAAHLATLRSIALSYGRLVTSEQIITAIKKAATNE